MSDGGAQRKVFGPFFSSAGVLYTGIKLNVYAVGTTNNKTYWTDEDKSTPGAHPLVDSDSDGIVSAFFDGDYRIQVKDSSGNALDDAIDWDSYKITSDTATLWEGNHGTSDVTPAAANRYQLFTKHTAGNVFNELQTHDGSSVITLVKKLADDSANVVDDIVTDKDLRFYLPAGFVSDGTVDYDTEIQAWIDASSAGDTLLAPNGKFLLTGVTVDKQLIIKGSGCPIVNGTQTGTVFIKAAASTSIGIDVTAQGVTLKDFLVDGASGNTNDGIRIKAGRVSIHRVAVNNQGNDGIRIGTSSTDNCNLWYMERIITDGNGNHGVNIDSNSGGTPDANGGTLNLLDSRNNTADGLSVQNAYVNTFIGIVVQTNTGYGIRCESDAINHRFFGGDQDETNTAGNILNEGTGNVFMGVSDVGFTDSGTATTRVGRVTSYMAELGLGTGAAPSGDAVLEALVGFTNAEEIARYRSTGNAAADRGFSFLYDLPTGASSATGVKFIMARAGSNDDAYFAVQVKENAQALEDVFKIDASAVAGETRMLLYDENAGTLQRVKVGANGTAATASHRELMVPDV